MGRLTAAKIDILGDSGAYASVGGKVLERAAGHACGPYRMPALDVEAVAAYTNNPPCGAMRGFGVNQTSFAIEGCLDLLAAKVGLDGWEMRWRNIVRVGDLTTTGQVLEKSVGAEKTLLAVKPAYDAARADGPRGRHRLRRSRTRASATARSNSASAAWSSSPAAWSSSTPASPRWARGCMTVLTQCAVEVTGLPARGIPAAGQQPLRARLRADDRLARHAARRARRDRRGREAEGRPRRRADALQSLSATVYAGETRIDDTTAEGELKGGKVKTHTTFGFATQVVVLDEKGALETVIAAHDVGRALNPQQCEAQIQGAVHMGLGYALTEELPCKDGMPVTFKLREIGVLRAQHMPRRRGHPGRGARARGAVRRQGGRRDRPGADRRRRRGRARRLRRRPAHAPADEGFAGRARHQRRPHSRRRAGLLAVTGALVVGPDRHGLSVAIEGGRVVAEPPPGAAHLACADGEIAPGAVCAHTHLYSGLARYGLPPPEPPPRSFVEILERVWWRLDRALDAQSLDAAARDYVARALLAGVTTLVDHHESPNLIEDSLPILAAACGDLGVRALLCYGASERNFGREEARRGLDACRNVPASPLVRGLVGLHASFTVSDETIGQAGALARELGTVVHVHVAEDGADVEDARRRGYAGPLERLMALDALPPGSILAHGVHLSRRSGAARGGGRLMVRPQSALERGQPRRLCGRAVGDAAGRARRRRLGPGHGGGGGGVAAARRGERRRWRRRAVWPRATRWRRSVSARRARRSRRARSATSWCGATAQVVHVVVGGRVVVRDGALLTGDFERITAEGRAEARRLWARMADL